MQEILSCPHLSCLPPYPLLANYCLQFSRSFLASSNLPGSFLGRMDWLHVYIACAAFAVCGFVALILFASRQTRKVDYDSGIFTYLKFIYASFLKPHEKNGSGQQDALESFYKTQVCQPVILPGVDVTDTSPPRPVCTMRLASASSADARTCWALLLRN